MSLTRALFALVLILIFRGNQLPSGSNFILAGRSYTEDAYYGLVITDTTTIFPYEVGKDLAIRDTPGFLRHHCHAPLAIIGKGTSLLCLSLLRYFSGYIRPTSHLPCRMALNKSSQVSSPSIYT